MRKFKAELKKQLTGKMPDEKMRFLPAGFQRIGDIIIINIPKDLVDYRKLIGETVLRLFKVRSVCARTGKIKGELRTPQVKIIAGKGSETIHKENNYLYKLDTVKLMFSKGNIKERARVAKLVKPDETIIDMFAGIGYFSIPIARNCPDCKIISIELNPTAVKYLRENCRLNKVKNIRIVSGDCREVGKLFQSKAKRIIMGYLPHTYRFLPAAFEMLGAEGTIHYHDTFGEDELWKRPLDILKMYAERAGYRMGKVLRKVKIKQYSPKVWHVVLDVKFTSS